MSAVAGLLPKLAVFVIATIVGGSATFVATGILGAKGPVSTAGIAPDFLLSADTPGSAPIAFNLVTAQQQPALIPGLPPADLSLAASSLLGGTPPVPKVKPLGFARVDPVSQFDGGPFAGANCTLAAGAMLARLGFGIVTSGSILRTLQDDQEGGTGLDDLQVALWRGYGVTIHTGLLTPPQLKGLLDAGYGAVIQGIYGRIPLPMRLQASFEGPHAIYLDGHYPGGHGTPEAYYVIDPLGRPFSRYDGDWWPASIIDDFGTAFGGGGRIPAAWVFPPGGVPPEVVGPDVLPIPPSPHGSPGPSPSPGSSPSVGPSGSAPPGPVEPGDTVVTPVIDPSIVADATLGGFDLVPYLLYCLALPTPPGCPGGIEGVFDIPALTLPSPPPGPAITVRFVDSDQPGRALVGFAVDPPGAPADVRFWEADGSPAVTHGASTMSTLTLLGQTTLIAQLDVLASTTYRFQVIAGDGASATASPVGTFTTAAGVVRFDVSLAATSDPTLELGSGFSPYVHLGAGGFAQPLIRLDGAAPSGCTGTAKYGGVGYCLGLEHPGSLTTCTRAQVSYELAGVAGSGVVIRAFPTEDGVLPDGSETLAGVLEAAGPLTTGDVGVGCLAPGMSYAVLLDVVGDDQGPIAGQVITLP